MPNIPQYKSNLGLTKESPLIKKSVALEVESGTGQFMQDVGGIIQNVGEKIRAIDNANAESKAAIDRARWEVEYSGQIDKEPDPYKALQNIENDTRKSRSTIANAHFHDPIAKQEWLRKQELSDTAYIINQNAMVAKKIASERRVLTFRDRDLAVSNGINAFTPEEKQMAQEQLREVVNNPANYDIFTAEERDKLIKDGMWKMERGIKDKESLRAKEEKEIQLARDYARDERENDLIKKRVDGELSMQEVRDAMDGDNPIDARVGQSLINSLKSPKTVAAKTDYGIYEKLMADIINPKKTATEIKAGITEAHNRGELSNADYKRLLYTRQLGQDPIFSKAQEEANPSTNPLVAMWNSIKEKFSNPKDRGEVMSGATDSLMSGSTETSKVVKDAVKNQLFKLHPWMLTLPKGGTDIMDSEGKLSHINEEGDLEEAE